MVAREAPTGVPGARMMVPKSVFSASSLLIGSKDVVALRTVALDRSERSTTNFVQPFHGLATISPPDITMAIGEAVGVEVVHGFDGGGNGQQTSLGVGRQDVVDWQVDDFGRYTVAMAAVVRVWMPHASADMIENVSIISS